MSDIELVNVRRLGVNYATRREKKASFVTAACTFACRSQSLAISCCQSVAQLPC